MEIDDSVYHRKNLTMEGLIPEGAGSPSAEPEEPFGSLSSRMLLSRLHAFRTKLHQFQRFSLEPSRFTGRIKQIIERKMFS